MVENQKATQNIYTPVPASTSEYSLSIPGSMMAAWKRIIKPEAPTSQKKVPNGDEKRSSGMPMTKRVMKS